MMPRRRRRPRERPSDDAAGPAGAEVSRFVYDGQNIVLEFNGAGQLTDRYLQGPVLDMVLANEQVNPSTGAGEVQGTCRDRPRR